MSSLGHTWKAYRSDDLAIVVADLLGMSYQGRTSKPYKIVRAIIKTIIDALRRGEKVKIVGFGTFWVKTRASRTNFPTHKYAGWTEGRIHGKLTYPAKKYVWFKPAKNIRREINHGYQ